MGEWGEFKNVLMEIRDGARMLYIINTNTLVNLICYSFLFVGALNFLLFSIRFNTTQTNINQNIMAGTTIIVQMLHNKVSAKEQWRMRAHCPVDK